VAPYNRKRFASGRNARAFFDSVYLTPSGEHMNIDEETTHMEWVREALRNAEIEGLSLNDCIAMADDAQTAQDFDRFVNQLIQSING
jgi:hypothetical protein